MTQMLKYPWLIETIRQFGPLTLKEISGHWENNRNLSEGRPLPRQTFNRWVNAIATQLGIEIKCDVHNGYTYYIDNYEEAVSDDSLSRWMVDTYAMCDMLADNSDIRRRISVPPIPSGHSNLVKVLSAIRNNSGLCITYQRFGCDPYEIFVYPLCVRLYDNRWYLVGERRDGSHRTYSLDRIRQIVLSGTIPEAIKAFDADAYFRDSFGIVKDDEIKSCIIVIRAYGNHANYMRTLPMHQSQEEIGHGTDEYGEFADFKYYMAPTYDLVMHIAGLGCMVRVLQPQSLVETMCEWIQNTAKMYGRHLSLPEKTAK